MLQTGVVPPQWLFAVQPTHCPPVTVVSQTGVAPLQPWPVVHRTQVLLPVLQMGVVPPQLPLDRHCTQRPCGTDVSQTLVAPPQPCAAVQVTHSKRVVSQ